jgi:hypothetical protein
MTGEFSVPYRIRLRKKGERDYRDVGDVRLDATPRYHSRMMIEIRGGVAVGRVTNIVVHRSTMRGAKPVDIVHIDEV